MRADDRTPDVREVRSMYDAGSNLFRETPEQHYLGHPAPDYGAEFDRFLARARRDIAREVLDELIADAEIDVRLGVEGGDNMRVQNAEAVIDAVTVYRDTEFPEENHE